MNKGKVVFLNGFTISGKTSIVDTIESSSDGGFESKCSEMALGL
ncbi:hypothetical protein [Paenibacillus sp. NPDC058071]